MGKVAPALDADDSLSIRAAWLHYAGSMTQAEIARQLGVSPAKVHRLVARALERGAVRITVEGPIAECMDLESRLRERFGLEEVRIAPDLREPDLPLRAIGAEGARLLEREFARTSGLLGFGHGRTLGAAIAELPRSDLADRRFVALMGGLTQNFAASPHDAMFQLAARTGATAHVMPVPFLANSPEDRAVLLAQRGVAGLVHLWAEAETMIVGIGTTQPDAQLVDAGMIAPEDIEEVERSGAVGEMLGHFFDAAGRPVDTGLTARTLSPDLDRLSPRRIVALAGGPRKVAAIRAVLRSGLLTGLVTDERTAQAVLAP